MTHIPTSLVGSYPQPDWLIDREALRQPLPAARARARAVARRPAPTSRRRRTTRRCSRSATRSAPGSTSSPTARSAARATPTASPPRSRASTSTTRAATLDRTRQPDAGAARRRPDPPRASRCRSTTCASCAPTPTAWSRSRVPGPFTMAQQAQNDFYEHEEDAGVRLRRRVREEIARPLRRRRRHRAARRAVDGGAPRAGAPLRRSRRCSARSTACRARRPCTSASAIRRSCPSTARATSSWPSSPPRPVDQISIETAQADLDVSRARGARRQDDHPRRARARHARGRDARDGGRADSPRAALQVAPSELVAAPGLRHEVPAARRRLRASCRRSSPAHASWPTKSPRARRYALDTDNVDCAN